MIAAYPWNRTGGPRTNRPFAELLVGPGRIRVWCLVDSGADHLMLDDAIGVQAGVSFAGARGYAVTTAGGPVSVQEVPNVDLEVEGVSGQEVCVFAPGAMPLLGRVTFLNIFGFLGFARSGWMHD